ncbi:MAG TPA: hypothetical protein PK239_12340 [Chitinophagales bacterium]|nr:hypothetical protein [Chitinophagales bacterium]
MKNKTLFNFILLLCLCSFHLSCKWYLEKYIDNCDGGLNHTLYTFYLPYTFSPAKDTFKINDTIHIHANFEDQLFDSTNLKYYKAEDAHLLSRFSIDKIDTVGLVSAFNSFNTLVDTGEIALGGGGGLYLMKYVYQDNHYKFHARLIPQKKGVYVFYLTARPYQEVDLQEHCRDEAMNLYFITNDLAENNFYLLAESPDIIWNGITRYDFNRFGMFCFRVVE